MALDKKSVSVLIILGMVSACLTLYTVIAHAVARYAYDNESGYGWLYHPSGSFFPWPKGPGMACALSKMNDSDVFIYRYMIKSWVLVGVTVLLWTVTSLYLLRRIIWRSGKRKKYARMKTRQKTTYGFKFPVESKPQNNIQLVEIHG